jgi:alkylation response protein AidB-like acyl-CoA dehydrogenase
MDFNLTADQKQLVAATRQYAEREIQPFAAQWDREEQIPRSQIQKYVAQGWLGMTLPEKYGGRGLPALDGILIIEEVARHCAVSGRIIVDHNFGVVGTILNFGTEDQRQRFLPPVCRGEKLVSIGMTEPEAGSALTDLTTTAHSDGVDFIINGEKRWITGAGEREWTLVYARFDDQSGPAGIGAILVDADRPGFTAGPRIPSLGVRGVREGVLKFNNVRVHKSNLIVPAGSGFGQLMSAYNGQRVAASAVALGIAQGAFDYALAYADQREQFGRRITAFQHTQFKLADMAIDIEAARLLVYRAAAGAEQTITDRYVSSMAKVYAAEMAIRVTNAAIQLLGAEGYGRHHPLERMYRDARAFTIAGGTAEMQRLGIAVKLLQRSIPQQK